MSINFLLKILIVASIIFWNSCQKKESSSIFVIVNRDAGITLFGEKIPLDNLQLLLLDSLGKMTTLPDSIDIRYEGEVLMGIRGEVGTEVAAALAEARRNRNLPRVEILSYRNEKGNDCDQLDSLRKNCAIIDLQYPVVEKGEAALMQNVKQWVDNYLIGVLTGGAQDEKATAKTLDEAAKVFFQTHESFKESVMYGGFVAESGSEVVFNNGDYLTLATNSYTFQGGAHGSPTSTIASFNAKTGKPLSWDDLITDKAALKTMAETFFRTEQKEAFTDGFEFDDTFTFKLPENFGVDESGIYFHYNPYEVGPYAIGSTTFTIPYSKINGMMKLEINTVGISGKGLSQDDPDLVAISDVIHGFYAWYYDFQNDQKKNINFTKEKGKHLVLDIPKLEQYFSNIKASGFISDELINNEIAALKQCEKLWKNESLDEPPSCVDYDRFFCAQDWDIEFWTQAPIGADGLGTKKVTATMSSGEGEGLQEQKFDLLKENEKWLIAKIYCE